MDSGPLSYLYREDDFPSRQALKDGMNIGIKRILIFLLCLTLTVPTVMLERNIWTDYELIMFTEEPKVITTTMVDMAIPDEELVEESIPSEDPITVPDEI